jgi:hypothetical protein
MSIAARPFPCRLALWAVCCHLALLASVTADTVVLRNGQRIEGAVRVDGEQVHVTTAEGKTVTVKRAEVERIDRTGTSAVEDVKITNDLRRRAERHRRFQALRRLLAAGGADARSAADTLRRAGPDALPFLAEGLDAGDDDTVRATLEALGAIGVRAAADLIAEQFPDLDSPLQLVALRELARIRAVHAAPAIIDLLGGEDTPADMQRTAVRALGLLCSDLAVPALVRALGRPATTTAATEALIALDSPSALSYLERLVESKAPAARSAAKIIGRIARPEHAGLLLHLRRSEDRVVRGAASDSLERLKENKASRLATYVAQVRSGTPREAAGAAAQLERLVGEKRTAKEWMAWWRDQNAGRVRVAVVALGKVDGAVLAFLKGAAAEATGLKAVVPDPLELSRWSRLPGSRRFRGDALLHQLEFWQREHPEVIAVLGVTAVPVEVTGSGAVMGLFRHGVCGLVSLPGLRPGAEAAVLRRRLRRYALHVLARALRIARTEDARCPAVPLYDPVELDGLRDTYSEDTTEHVKASIAASVAALAGDLDDAIRTVSRLKDVADPRQNAIELAFLAERRRNLDLARRFWRSAAKRPGEAAETKLIEARVTLIESLAGAKDND